MSKPKSALLEMRERHRQEEETLMYRCKHEKKFIKIDYSRSSIGMGTSVPTVHVICRNCGRKKIMFRNGGRDMKVKIEKTLKRQKGITDQRLQCFIEHDWELK